jgi:hypothetical protein
VRARLVGLPGDAEAPDDLIEVGFRDFSRWGLGLIFRFAFGVGQGGSSSWTHYAPREAVDASA